MNYEEFTVSLLEGLEDFYGKDAVVQVKEVQKNNGRAEKGVCIQFPDREGGIAPLLPLQGLYEAYRQDGLCLEDCVEMVYKMREEHEYPEEDVHTIHQLKSWPFARKKVYPILLSEKENAGQLQELVSTRFLDFAIAYTIRLEGGEGFRMVKITYTLLDSYGISKEELHRQAIENLQKDGYSFQDMYTFLEGMLPAGIQMERGEKELLQGKMYILTNRAGFYGAPGILHKELLREFARGQSFYILPSSVHETIFLFADEGDKKQLDRLVEEVNGTAVAEQERLSDHSYYYDGRTGEIRMCA